MTTIRVPGKITALEIDESGGLSLSSLVGGTLASPTVIFPSGKPTTIVLTPGDNNSNGNYNFELDSSFKVGDIVEVYVTTPGYGFAVKDENGTAILNGALVPGMRLRKIRTGIAIPTWGVVA